MRTQQLLQTMVLGAAMVAVSGVHAPQIQDKPAATRVTAQERKVAARPQNKTSRATEKATEKATDKATDKAKQESQQVQERRRSSNHITSAFPRTRSLLGYLEKNDERALDAVLSHSIKLTSRREAAALRLAKEHHPELQKLILQSKGRYPKAYASAIRELVADHVRLQRAQQVSEKEFDAALTEWKLRSQARLIAARMTVDNQPELQTQLEALLTQGESAKRRQIQMQIERYQEQIQRLQQRLDQDPTRNVKRQMRTINNRVKPNKRKGK